jgi:hypothetical protein
MWQLHRGMTTAAVRLKALSCPLATDSSSHARAWTTWFKIKHLWNWLCCTLGTHFAVLLKLDLKTCHPHCSFWLILSPVLWRQRQRMKVGHDPFLLQCGLILLSYDKLYAIHDSGAAVLLDWFPDVLPSCYRVQASHKNETNAFFVCQLATK